MTTLLTTTLLAAPTSTDRLSRPAPPLQRHPGELRAVHPGRAVEVGAPLRYLASTGYAGITRIRYASAWCESGGNIHAISKHPAGVYRGKWQFDWSTWRTYAPAGWKTTDPAYAPEWVQDKAALAVPYDAWPNC